jgi:small subunit ribosomal protein S8
MVSDSISDMLTRIKNGYMARKSEVDVPWTKLLEAIANILVKQKFIQSCETITDGRKLLKLTLKYNQKEPAITDIRRVSKPSLRIYVSKNRLPKVLGGLGMALISTPAGLMTDYEARKKGLGGEVICEIW